MWLSSVIRCSRLSPSLSPSSPGLFRLEISLFSLIVYGVSHVETSSRLEIKDHIQITSPDRAHILPMWSGTRKKRKKGKKERENHRFIALAQLRMDY